MEWVTLKREGEGGTNSLVQETNVKLRYTRFTLKAILDHLQSHLSIFGRGHLMAQSGEHTGHQHAC